MGLLVPNRIEPAVLAHIGRSQDWEADGRYMQGGANEPDAADRHDLWRNKFPRPPTATKEQLLSYYTSQLQLQYCVWGPPDNPFMGATKYKVEKEKRKQIERETKN